MMPPPFLVKAQNTVDGIVGFIDTELLRFFSIPLLSCSMMLQGEEWGLIFSLPRLSRDVDAS